MTVLTSEGEPDYLIEKVESEPESPLELKLDEVGARSFSEILNSYARYLHNDGDLQKAMTVRIARQVVEGFLIEAIPRVAREELDKESGVIP